MEVRVVSAESATGCPEKDYVRVHTYSDPFDDTVTLATIVRVVEKPRSAAARASDVIKRVKTLIMRQRMSPEQALDLATSYAEHKNIPVVYADGDQSKPS
jgi:hypothetical protein